jgi:predicted nucleic acid-binding Zn ribbon protein
MKGVPGSLHLSRALADLISLRGLAGSRGNDQLAEAWRDVVAGEFVERTKVLGVKRGILRVGVASAPLLSELVSFHKAELLDALQSRHADLRIRDLQFRLQSGIGE